MLDVTFFDWDAIIYSIQDKKITYHPSYFDRLRRRVLDINLAPNPNPLGNAVRALRYAHRWNASFGQALADHVLRQLTDKGWESFVRGERSSFSAPVLYGFDEALIRNHLEQQLRAGCEVVALPFEPRQIELQL